MTFDAIYDYYFDSSSETEYDEDGNPILDLKSEQEDEEEIDQLLHEYGLEQDNKLSWWLNY